MAVQTFPLTIARREQNTKDAVSLYLDIPANMREVFDYEPGQYLSIDFDINGETVRRSYSFCTSPLSDSQPGFTVKRVAGGLVSNFLNDHAEAGMKIAAQQPMGYFIPNLNSVNKKHYLLFAAGSGITPILSILKSILRLEQDSRISMLYGNTSEDSIIFKNELNNLSEQEGDRFYLRHCLSQPGPGFNGEIGRIDPEKILRFTKERKNNSDQNEYFICGPTGMIQTVENSLLTAFIPSEEIHKEYFVLPEKESSEAVVSAATNTDGTTTVKVIFDKKEYSLDISPNETILDAAIDADVDPPFACMAAACSTCKARLVSGTVMMDDSDILSPSEIEAGMILTCQAHPTSGDVVITYD